RDENSRLKGRPHDCRLPGFAPERRYIHTTKAATAFLACRRLDVDFALRSGAECRRARATQKDSAIRFTARRGPARRTCRSPPPRPRAPVRSGAGPARVAPVGRLSSPLFAGLVPVASPGFRLTVAFSGQYYLVIVMGAQRLAQSMEGGST